MICVVSHACSHRHPQGFVSLQLLNCVGECRSLHPVLLVATNAMSAEPFLVSKIPDERQLRRELRIVVFHMLQQEKAEAEKARLFAASDPPAASAAVPSLESDAAAAAASAVSDVSTAAADVASAAVAQVFSPGYKWPGRANFCAAGDFRAQLCTRTLMPCQLEHLTKEAFREKFCGFIMFTLEFVACIAAHLRQTCVSCHLLLDHNHPQMIWSRRQHAPILREDERWTPR